MLSKRVLAMAAGALLAAAGVAVAAGFASTRQADFFARGTHQFYVWCPGGRDYVATADGANAGDAQMKLYARTKVDGHRACWPVWQGRVGG